MLKIYIGLAILGAVCAYKTQGIFVEDYPEPYNEAPCLYSGGICVVADECPDGKLAGTSGLCPEQQKQGVECCYGISKNDKRCKSNGGECKPASDSCPDNLTYNEAIDCECDQKCCVLVK